MVGKIIKRIFFGKKNFFKRKNKSEGKIIVRSIVIENIYYLNQKTRYILNFILRKKENNNLSNIISIFCIN